jgi:hypothetical protein
MVSDLLGAPALATAGMMMAMRAATAAADIHTTVVHLIILLGFLISLPSTHPKRRTMLTFFPVLFPATTKPIEMTSTAKTIQEVVMVARRPWVLKWACQMGSHHGFDACSSRKMERIWVEMTREDRAIQMPRAKRRRGDRVIGRMAMVESCRFLEEEIGGFGQGECKDSVPAVIVKKWIKQ